MFRCAYDANGRLTNRWSPAKGTTRYVYDKVGNLTLVDYPSSTDISMGYDGDNRLTSMSDASGSSTFGYAAFGPLASEDGPWSNDTITYSYARGRKTAFSLQQLNASPWPVSYAYDAAMRLTNITSPAGAFGYAYHTGLHSGVTSASPLVQKLTLPNGAHIDNAYDADMARWTSTALVSSGGATLNAHGYTYNEFNQRVQFTRTDSFVDYAYDHLGQLISAYGYQPNTNRWHERFDYVYDGAGNLLYRTNYTLVQAFGVNNLNQLTNQSRSGRMSVAGTTSSAATNVTVNTSNAIRYADFTFVSTNHTLLNGTNTFTAIAKDTLGRVDTNIVTAYLPTNSVFLYDLNGNMVFDGQNAFQYDDENELVRITATNAWKSEFTYDGKMRRRVRKEYTWRSGVWTLTNEVHYIYDGNLVIQERDQNNVPQVTYTRGKDLSGSLEGAGGIGGLLARTDNSTLNAQPSHAYYHADGNGNITMLISAQQVTEARYLFDPFANTLSRSGPLADCNSYQFSSKETHEASGLSFYGRRYYARNTQRWINRDPIQEDGGLNLYAFVGNSPVHHVDAFGHGKWDFLYPGKCCNAGSQTEWYLKDGRWYPLAPGSCTGQFTDCDGLTCNGSFYYVSGFETGSCDGTCVRTPGNWNEYCKKPCWNDRAWSPGGGGDHAIPPGPCQPGKNRGAPNCAPPPGYHWL